MNPYTTCTFFFLPALTVFIFDNMLRTIYWQENERVKQRVHDVETESVSTCLELLILPRLLEKHEITYHHEIIINLLLRAPKSSSSKMM